MNQRITVYLCWITGRECVNLMRLIAERERRERIMEREPFRVLRTWWRRMEWIKEQSG